MQIRESSKKASVAVAAASVSRSNLGSGSSENAQPNNPATTQTTAWLDRANSALSGPSLDDPEDISNLQLQIQQVQQLIDESTALKEANLELNCVLDEKSSVAPANEISPVHEVEPADKRMKTTEDAEALVGFLQQVRASAASGEQL